MPEFKSNKHVFINGRFLLQSVSGVQKYAHGISEAFHELGYKVTFLCPKNVQEVPAYADVIRIGKYSGHLWEQIDLYRYCKRNNDIFLINLCNSAPLRKKNQWVTIHDISFRKFPDFFSKGYRTWYSFMTPKVLRNSEIITTVSEFSKAEIIEEYSLPDSRVHLLKNGLFFRDVRARKPDIDLEENDFVLFVGGHDPRKRLKSVIEKWDNSMPPLLVTGRYGKVFSDIDHQQAKNIIFHYNCTDSELIWMYRNASLMLYPSLYEGFGLPVLEALSFDCPCLVSDLPVFRDIFSDYVEYFVSFDHIQQRINDVMRTASSERWKKTSEYVNEKFSYYKFLEEFLAFV